MYSLLYHLFFFLKRHRETRSGKERGKLYNKILNTYVNFFDLFLNAFMPKYYKKFGTNKSGVTKVKREQKIIASLTSFPARIDKLWIVIETIFRQHTKADEVILWLAKEQFPNEFEDLPEELLSQTKRGLTIRFCDDLRSHKKYYYTFSEYPNDCVILFDDDTFYAYDLISKLYKQHIKNPQNIICMQAQCVPDIRSMPSVWPTFGPYTGCIKTITAQPFSGQGTLYVPSLFTTKVLDKDLCRKLTPYADDLWLYMHSYLSNIEMVFAAKHRCFSITLWSSGSSALANINTGDGDNQNDMQWKALTDYYLKEETK